MTRRKFKIWHISDTHGDHELLTVPKRMRAVIHSGDFTNYYDVARNEPEARKFLKWFGSLKIKHKILIAGNHDAFVAKRTQEFKNLCAMYGIIYLENDWTYIEDVKIWGSPYTPTFCTWHFMKDRSKLHDVWKEIPEDTDIVVVHGPPKGVLDASYRHDGFTDKCGCISLKKHILESVKPKFVLFGHIHNNKDIINAGILKLSVHDTIFSNGSVVTDGKFGRLSSNGNIIEI
jgi:Icc-related predicted phosphoesterase